MLAGLSAIQEVIFPTLPVFLRRVDASLEKIGQPMLPLDHVLFSFGSWMGGDRDGNPNVTHETTRDVCILGRTAGCDVFFRELQNLMLDLSVWRSNKAVKVEFSPNLIPCKFVRKYVCSRNHHAQIKCS